MSCAPVTRTYKHTHSCRHWKLCCAFEHTPQTLNILYIISFRHISNPSSFIIVIVIVITRDWSAIRWFSVCYRLVVESVAGWFRVWSVCVKAQLHVQSFMSLPTPSPTHTPPFFACLTFFFFHHWLSVWGWEGPLGSERGFNKIESPRGGSRYSAH